ncbi:DUF2268 domain-containing putative Zn-dependent protease [Lutimonas halocynthiae]|uniref:DUF2268 domain-containing putative Zn-dependent protease n=1 Tax=Lutimonas halocynthiae TaxID=1446477 RepID=UPI0025B2AD1D|nr:DUF2268 domain-containing putative Zn-dependent protease [Lutimonas halocynthiae]MDN3641682.1 DUF2268 domain-containing putative Zn-dependent protease [Lutimonas halocynthiae]
MILRRFVLIAAALIFSPTLKSQENFSTNPLEAQFITEDVDRFWTAFDEMEQTGNNTFQKYIDQGSPGLKGFIDNRIINADSLYNMVASRKSDYLKSKNLLKDLESKRKRIVSIYAAMKYWYPQSVFPPIYFVVGRYNSGGTVSEAGVILGVEKQNDLNGLPGLVAHELIHFQQKSLGEDEDLLFQCIIEGSADFIGELISGEQINGDAFTYGEKNQEKLCKEFVQIMHKSNYNDWLYGTSGKDDRPNDLGYWMGYKITESYFYNHADKKKAIEEILLMNDAKSFLKISGFLDEYAE